MGMLCRMVTRSGPTRTSLTTLRSTFWRSSTVAVSAGVAQAGEEALEVLGQLEVGVLVDQLGVEGVERGLRGWSVWLAGRACGRVARRG